MTDGKNAFVGKWKLVDSKNFDEYMKTVGVGWLTRTAGALAKPELTIAVKDDHWVMDSRSTFKDIHTEFTEGKEFAETTPDGREMKSVCSFRDGALIQEQTKIKADDHNSTFKRFINSEGKLIAEITSEGVTATRVYEKIK